MKILERSLIGKLVLVEKPLFSSNYKLRKNLRNTYFVGYNLRYHSVIQFIKKYLKGKKVFSVSSSCLTFLPNWRNTNYKNTVSAQRKLGGGVKFELSHEIDYLRWIFGEVKLLFSYNKKISNLKMDCDDILLFNGISKNKTLINLNLNFFSRIEKREVIINGNNFSIKGDLIKNNLTLVEKNKIKKIRFKKFDITNSFKNEHIDIMNKNYKTCCNLAQALKVQKILNQIRTTLWELL